MNGVLRPLVVFGVSGAVSLAALQFSGGAWGSDRTPPPPQMSNSVTVDTGYGNLAELELVEPTLHYIEESYVEPSRVDYDAMYIAALEAVEQRVPVTMFRREPGGTLLHLEAGTYKTSFDVPKLTSRKDLQRELARVADVLASHLSETDIPMDDSEIGSPYAQIEYAMINGMLGTLDPHSRLFPPAAAEELNTDNAGEFGGLGITIEDRKGKLTVSYPMPGTPAERIGLKSDDQIVRIDGVSTVNMSIDEAVGKLRGIVGAPVDIEVKREGADQPLKFHIFRERILPNEVTSVLLEGNIGYVDVPGFNKLVSEQLVTQLNKLERESGGLKGLIIDLRDNPGGFLVQAEKISDTFLKSGTIVSQVDANGRKLEQYDARDSGNEPTYPIAVLTTAQSASASEIVAGALRNNERAIIIGERTYGKGSVQNLHDFSDHSELKLTISKYLTPGDKSIQAVGIPADIELIPAQVGKLPKSTPVGGATAPTAVSPLLDVPVGSAESDDVARMFFRERVHREADSDKHLEQVALRAEDASYSLRYLVPLDEKRAKKGPGVDVSSDYQIKFARDVLIAAPSARRADMLAAAAPIVERYSREGNTKVEAAFTTLGIDWSNGVGVTNPDLAVSYAIGKDGVLTAGDAETLTVSVTNNGKTPIYRLAAVASFDEDYSAREFFFGKIAPGQTRTYSQPVEFVAGHPTEVKPVKFEFRDAAGPVVTQEQRIPVQGKALPRLTWQTQVSDVAPGGDGDGIAEVGETLTIGVSIKNEGKGSTREAFARIRNKSGRALDIVQGTVEPGTMRTAAGVACSPLTPGIDGGNIVGDANSKEVKQFDPPTWPGDCSRSLNPGETWTGSFSVLVKEVPAVGSPELEFDLGDAAVYDHASIFREAFYSYFTNRQDLTFTIGAKLPTFVAGEPPQIQVTRAPEILVKGNRATVSGVVTDNTGISHVEVYHGADKVFFQGSLADAHIRSVPYTADLDLKPGQNTISVLATDENGFTSTASVVTFYVDAALAAKGPSTTPTVTRVQ